MKIAICDDEAVQCELLHTMVNRYLKMHQLPAAVYCFKSSEELLFQYEEHADLDILLLDIQMKEMNGIQLAENLRQRNEHLSIIFVTGAIDYIYESFRLQAVNYLLKPVDEQKLSVCLDAAIQQNLKRNDMLVFTTEKELIRLSYSSVYHICSEGHYLHIYTLDHVWRIKRNLRDILQEISDERFLKIGKSDVVNLEAVDKITSRQLTLIDKTAIPIPKGRYREISEAFIRYHFADAKSV